MLIILLLFIFIRPFISSLAFPLENSIYSSSLLCFLIIYNFVYKPDIKKLQEIKYPLIFFLLSLIISFIFSSLKLNSLSRLSDNLLGVLLLITMFSVPDKNRIQVLRVIVLSGIIVSIMAIYQYFFGFQHLSEYIAKKGIDNSFIIDCIKQKRVFPPFMTPNILAGFLAMVIFLAAAINSKYKLLILFFMFAAFLLTKSLGGILSFFIGVCVYFYLKKYLFSWKSIFPLFILTITIGIIFLSRLENVKQNFLPGFSLINRIEYWQQTISIIKLHPFLGIGLGNLNLPMSRYAHNLYLQYWAEAGIIGLISFIWLIGSILRLGVKNIKNSANKAIAIALFISSVSFLVDNFVSFSFYLPEVSIIWWVILGILASL